jgi:ubiquinone/menaquinone biosynthesis C-methylase UbiE
MAHKNPNLSILEIGAGTGGATHSALSALGGSNNRSTARFSRYTFTDTSAGFFEKAAAKFGAWKSRLDFQVLDIEQDPLGQGFEAAQFDLIIASNVLHATKSIDQTLQNIGRVLKPGGKLCLTEITSPRLRTSVIFGTLPGWWR